MRQKRTGSLLAAADRQSGTTMRLHNAESTGSGQDSCPNVTSLAGCVPGGHLDEHQETLKGLTEAKFEQEFHGNFGFIVRFLKSRGLRHEDAEDVAQTSLMRLWEYRDDIREPARLFAWLAVVSRHIVNSNARRQMPMMLCGEGPEVHPELDLRIAIEQALEKLPPRQHQMMEGQLNGEAYREIATRLGVKIGTVYHGISQGRAALETLLTSARSGVR